MLLRQRHRQLVWAHRKNAVLGGGVSEALSISDSFTVVVPSSGSTPGVQLRRRHRQIRWTHSFRATASVGGAAETATISDAVSASWGTSAAVSDALTITDLDAYPRAAQIMYRGRNAVLWWRQPEASGVGIQSSAAVVETLSASETEATAAGFVGPVAEALASVDTVSATLNGANAAAGHGTPKSVTRPKRKRHETLEPKAEPVAQPAVAPAEAVAQAQPAVNALPAPVVVPPDDDELALLLLMQ